MVKLEKNTQVSQVFLSKIVWEKLGVFYHNFLNIKLYPIILAVKDYNLKLFI